MRVWNNLSRLHVWHFKSRIFLLKCLQAPLCLLKEDVIGFGIRVKRTMT